MPKRREVEVSLLREWIDYDPISGRFHWKPRRPEHFSNKTGKAEGYCRHWNSRNAGRECFLADNGHGYFCASIKNRLFVAHRVAWAISTGGWPFDTVDHINGDRRDNRLANLRLATRGQNSTYRPSKPGSSSKYRGVTWSKKRMTWVASIKVGGKARYLGSDNDEAAAALIYDNAARTEFGEFAILNFP